MRTRHLFVTIVTVAALSTLSFTARAQTPKPGDAIVGAWTLNKSASDLGAADGEGRRGGDDGQRGDGEIGRAHV